MDPDHNKEIRHLTQFRSPELAFEYIADHYGENKDEVIRSLKVWDTLGELEYLTIFEIYQRIEQELGRGIPK